MKQLLRKGLKDIVVETVPDPVAGPHHVLIRPVYSLISSGTETASIHQEGVIKEVADNPSHIRKVLDVMQMNGPIPTMREVNAKFSEYAALGYSGAGILVEKHPTVTDLEPGARVAYGGEGTGHAETIVTGRQLVARVPDNVPFENACFATLGSIALNSVRISNISLGESVVIIGLGLVGQLTAQLARLQGGRVIAMDLRPERMELARKLGAWQTVAAGSGAKEAVLALTDGRGADVVIIAAAAKSDAPSKAALELCRDRGRIVVVGAVQMNFPWYEMYMKEIQLYLSRAYGPGSYDANYEKGGQDYPFAYVRWTENRNMEQFLQLLGSRQVSVEPLVTHQFPLEEAPKAYETILQPGSTSLAVLLRYANTGTPESFVPQRRAEITPLVGTPSTGELGFALIGAGNLARWAHLPALQKIGGTRLVAVQSGGGVRAKNYASRFKANYATTELKDVLADNAVGAVLITSRNAAHARESIAALEAGKHVFVEKPMALTVDECRRLYQAAGKSGKVLMVGFNRRWAPFYVQMKQKVKTRNGPVIINCRMNSPGISGSYWMADPSIGGAILGEACHFVDLMYWLLDSEPVSVYACSLPTDVKEPVGQNNVAASFRFADGSVANLTYGTIGSKTSQGERVEVFAQGLGVITENFKQLSVCGTLRRNSSKWFADKGYDVQLQAFVEAIRRGGPSPVSVLDGARASLGCIRLMESCRSGQVEPIRLTDVTS